MELTVIVFGHFSFEVILILLIKSAGKLRSLLKNTTKEGIKNCSKLK